MNTNTWILVADSSQAHLFSVAKRGEPWSMVCEFKHPQSRVNGGELTTDKPGRGQSSQGQGHRSAMEPKTPPKEVEVEHFATELNRFLTEGHGKQQYQRLVVVAPPHLLGLIRKGMSDPVHKSLGATLDKEYTHVSAADLHKHLDLLV